MTRINAMPKIGEVLNQERLKEFFTRAVLAKLGTSNPRARTNTNP
jgi:hypothetical protein